MEDFSTLLAKARRGEGQALGELYEHHAREVLAAARRRLSPELRRHYDTLDLAQSVFADVIPALSGFTDQGEDAFRHWLFIKVENKIRDKLRKHLGKNKGRREPLIAVDEEPPSSDPSPSTVAIGREKEQTARDLLDSLDEPVRSIVRMRLQEGLSWEKIAERTGDRSADAVRKQFQRCMAKIRSGRRGR